jgi:hypothetical protein
VHPDYEAATFGGQLAAAAADHPGAVFLRCGAEAMTPAGKIAKARLRTSPPAPVTGDAPA